MNRVEILDNVESLFDKAGFFLSQRCNVRPSCFDFVARKEEQLVFVKVQPNIGNVYDRDALGLATMSKLFSARPILVCSKSRNRSLEDDTVYTRYNLVAVTPATLENVLLEGKAPLIEAGPGGYYVRLDGEAIRKRRLEKGLSMGKMAEISGVSRRTLYGYEHGMAKASVSTAYQLEWVLGMPIAKPIDIFNYHSGKKPGFLATAKRMISKSRFFQFVIKKMVQFNFSVFQLRRAPFDFVAKAPEEKKSILGAIATKNDDNLKCRLEEIVSVSKVVEAQPIFVVNCKGLRADNIPIIHREDLERIKCPEDLIGSL